MINDIYRIVEAQYFESNDFNGLAVRQLGDTYAVNSDDFRLLIKAAIRDEVLESRADVNPHIRAFSKIPIDRQISYIDSENYPDQVCLYPHPRKLQDLPQLERYVEKPYTLALAKGAGQLDFKTFELIVLENYRNDPRYSYTTDFIHGSIYVANDAENLREHDRIFLQTFGFAYDEALNRYVAVFLRYLSDLSSQHQQMWAAREVQGEIFLHPDYFRSSILGEYGTRISIFNAFLDELNVINQMCVLMGKPPLFRQDFREQPLPKFGFLLRPTQTEFNDFVLLLDNMMSDNLNKEFFRGELELDVEIPRRDGRIEVRPKGTIALLEEWISERFRPQDETLIPEMMAAFRNVRTLRQRPAHGVNMDVFDQNIFRQQRDIVIEAYDAIRHIRQMLANHPRVRANPPIIDRLLFDGEIWDI